MAKHNTGKKRNSRQKLKGRYSKVREDAQTYGIIETTPEGAVRNEMVDPDTQGSQPLPGLVGQAVRNGWATPEEKKPRIIDEMIRLVEDDDTEPHVKVAATRVLQQGDQQQWERDNPELAGKTKGGGKGDVNVSVTTQLNLLELARQRMAQPDPIALAKQQALEAKNDRQREIAQPGGTGTAEADVRREGDQAST